ncbi:MAG: NnrU family protein [Alphaproteobacteria bacterium]|nr:NnrU family protein [Alphaproteobacteria bacterium]
MTSLALAVVALLVTHFSASTPVRPAVVARVGEPAWLGLYSLVAFAVFGWLGWAWAHAPTVWIWAPTVTALRVPSVIMPLSVILVVASLTTPNPAMVGADRMLDAAEPVQGLLRITRHPMLWGFALWSVAHMVANPDVASWWLFGGMATLSLGGTLAQDVKKARDLGDRWTHYAQVTSNVPFVAILTGRQGWPTDRRLVPQVLGGLAIYAILGLAHPLVFGVTAFH